MKKVLLIILSLTLCLSIAAFFGCDKNEQSTPSTPPTPPVIEAEVPDNATYSVEVNQAPNAIYLNGCEFESIKFDGTVLNENEYILNNGYVALKYRTYAEMGTHNHVCEITTKQGKFVVTYFIKGYVADYKTVDAQKTLSITERSE